MVKHGKMISMEFPIIIIESEYNKYLTQKHKLELITITAIIKGFKEMEQKFDEIVVKCAHCDWEGTNEESFKHSETTGHTFYSIKKIEKE